MNKVIYHIKEVHHECYVINKQKNSKAFNKRWVNVKLTANVWGDVMTITVGFRLEDWKKVKADGYYENY